MGRSSKYRWIEEYAAELAAARVPGAVTYRRCARMGGHYDNLSVIVKYVAVSSVDGSRRLWKSHGEVVRLIPSYISTAPLLAGSIHNQDAGVVLM